MKEEPRMNTDQDLEIIFFWSIPSEFLVDHGVYGGVSSGGEVLELLPLPQVSFTFAETTTVFRAS